MNERQPRPTLRKSAPLAALPVALTLAGCVHFKARPLSVDQAAQAFAERSLSSPALIAFACTNAPGHRLPSAGQPWGLADLTPAAFHFHPSLEVARAQWRVATAGRITAAQVPNPQFNATRAAELLQRRAAEQEAIVELLDGRLRAGDVAGIEVAQARIASRQARLMLLDAERQVTDARSRLAAAIGLPAGAPAGRLKAPWRWSSSAG